MKKFRITVKHDEGKAVLTITATDEAAARAIVLASELCPESAIIKVTCKQISN